MYAVTNTRFDKQSLRRFPLFHILFRTLITSLLFFPKLNIFYLPGFSVAVKIEDIIWGFLVISCVKYRNRLARPQSLIFFILLTYIFFSAILFPGNIVLAARLFFYALPILLLFKLDKNDIKFFIFLFKIFARFFALIAILQITIPFFYVHTGEIHFGLNERASGIFGNGVEFALVAFMTIWVLRFLNKLTFIDYCLLLIIGFCSGSRIAMAAILLSGLIIFGRQYLLRSLLAIPLILLAAAPFTYLFLETRYADIDVISLISSVQYLLGEIYSKELAEANVGQYCFDFNDDLATDQSFAMRLSKAKFVLEYVVIGAHPLGFGLGNCIGDAGDNLYVRIFSDGGYPYFLLLVLFFISLFFIKTVKKNSGEWNYFLIMFLGVSFFYDTLYFSRVSPLFFFVILLMFQFKNDLKLESRR